MGLSILALFLRVLRFSSCLCLSVNVPFSLFIHLQATPCIITAIQNIVKYNNPLYLSLSLPLALQTTDFIAVWLWLWISKSLIVIRRLISRNTIETVTQILYFLAFSNTGPVELSGERQRGTCGRACVYMRVFACGREIWWCQRTEMQCVTVMYTTLSSLANTNLNYRPLGSDRVNPIDMAHHNC